MGSRAPGPRQADSSIAGAAGEALKMDRDMHKMEADMQAAEAVDAAEREQRKINSGVNFKPGEPMVNPSSR